MIQKFSSSEDTVKVLRGEAGKTCLTITIPLRHLSPSQKSDWLQLDEAIIQALSLMKARPLSQSLKIKDILQELKDTVSFNRNDKGLGIYISEDVAVYQTFPFAVRENISIDFKFRFKELYQLSQFAAPYLLLFISESKARLFQGKDLMFKEIRQGGFPMNYVDDYEYATPSRSSSYAGNAHVKSFELDKRSGEKMRFADFLNKVDEHLDSFLSGSKINLWLCGTHTHTNSFISQSRFSDRISGTSTGGYDWFDEKEFHELIRSQAETLTRVEITSQIGQCEELKGQGLLVYGIEQVWNAIAAGKARSVLIDKDFDQPYYISADMPNVISATPLSIPNQFVNSIANELIDLCESRNCRVVFTESGELDNYDRVVAILRY